MRLRRLELAVISLTLAFICFMGGYFTGRRGVVNIVTIAPQQSQEQHIAEAAAPPALAAPEGQKISGAADAGASADAGAGAVGSAVPSGNTEEDGSAGLEQATEIVGAPIIGDGKININLASQSELMDLPGIGSVIASRIVDYRRQHGVFSRIEDLRKVSGIGEKRFEAIRDRITVG